MLIKYPFTPESVEAFTGSTLAETLEAIDAGDAEDQDIFITIGNREIKIPMNADTFSALEDFLKNCLALEAE